MIQRNIIPIKGLKNTKGSIFTRIEEKIPAPYVFYSIKTKSTQKLTREKPNFMYGQGP